MLMQFNFENYKSFLDDNSLNMAASNITEYKDELIVDSVTGAEYLNLSVVYGANASGKSNLLEAFRYMKKLVEESFSSSNISTYIKVTPFMFDATGSTSDTVFEVFIKTNGEYYQYGFKINKAEIKEEWLYKKNKKGKYDVVFERKGDKYNLRSDLKIASKLLKVVKPQILLISVLAGLDMPDVSNVYNWFKNTRVINIPKYSFAGMLDREMEEILEDEVKKNKFHKFLNDIDVDIKGVRIETSDEDIFGTTKSAYTQHTNHDTGDRVEIPLHAESNGTRKVINLYYPIFDALENGYTLFVDEMDANIHTFLTKYLVNLFRNKKNNPKGAQLIFTTHDVNLLENGYLRRDQIWFVEKNNREISDLFSLVEFKTEDDKKIRKDASYRKDYLNSKYGAVPDLKPIYMEE